MSRVTKSVTAKAKHKKVLKSTKGHYGARSNYIKLRNSLILNRCNMPSGTEKIEKEHSDLFGLQELMLVQEN